MEGPVKPKPLTEIEQNVCTILAKYPEARDNYQVLVLRYVREIDNVEMFIPFNDLGRVTPFESITRACRNIQNNLRLYLPTEDTQRRRNGQQTDFKQHYGGQNANR